MPGPINDSMRPYDPSMNKFHIGNPTNVSQPKRMEAIQDGDILEPSERDIEGNLRGGTLDPAERLNAMYSVVVSGGKYVFLAIMLPPYLCIYGFPRWLLMNAMPKIFHFIHIEMAKVGAYLFEKAESVVDLMKGVLQQMLGESLSSMNDRAKDLASSILAMLKNSGNALSSMKQELKNQFIKLSIAFFDNAEWAARAFVDKSREIAHQIAQRANQMLNSLGQSVANTLGPTLAQLSEMADRAREALGDGISAVADQMKKLVEPALLASQAAAQIMMQQSVQAMQVVIQPIFAFSQTLFNQANQQFQKMTGKAAEMFAKAGNAISNMAKQFVFDNVVRLKNGFMAMNRSLFKKMGQFFGQGQKDGRKGVIAAVLEGISDGGDAVMARVSSLLSLLAAKLAQWIESLKTVIVKWILSVSQFIVNLPRKSVHFFVKAMSVVAYGFRLMGREVGYLSRSFQEIYYQGMGQVRSMSDEVMALLGQKKFNG